MTVVDENSLAKRTIKYLKGLAVGAYIVDSSWVNDSVAARSWVDETKYMVVGDSTNGVTGAAVASREAGMTRLLDGLSVSIVGDFSTFGNPSVDDVMELAELGGAEILELEEYSSSQVRDRIQWFILAPYDMSLEASQQLHRRFRVSIISVSWLLDSISSYKLQELDPYRLEIDHEHL